MESIMSANIPAGYPSTQQEAFQFLASRKKLGIDDLKILALLEASGEAFYLALAAVTSNDEIRALLTRNGQEERGHAHRLLKAISLLGAEPYVLPADADNPYILPMQLDGLLNKDFLEFLEKGEMDGDLTYQVWADAESNAEVAKLYRLNGSEETRHGQRVAQVRELLSKAL
jgi:rubrerythrin